MCHLGLLLLLQHRLHLLHGCAVVEVFHLAIYIVPLTHFVPQRKPQIVSVRLVGHRGLSLLLARRQCMLLLDISLAPERVITLRRGTYTAIFSLAVSASYRHLLNRSSSSLRPCGPRFLRNLDLVHSFCRFL